MPSSLLKYHRNNISPCDTNHHPRTITAYYSYYGKHPNTYKPSGSYILFVRDSSGGSSSDKNIYIETQSVSIIIPYKDLHKYHKLYVYYIIYILCLCMLYKIINMYVKTCSDCYFFYFFYN